MQPYQENKLCGDIHYKGFNVGDEAMTLQGYRPVHTNVQFTCSGAGSHHGESSVMMATTVIDAHQH